MLYDKMMYEMYKEKDIKINQDLYINHREDDIVKYIIDVLKIYERVPNIKLTRWDYITDETEIDAYIVNQKHSKSKIDYKKVLPIDDSRYDLLKVYFDVESETKVVEYHIDLLLPKRYKRFYYLLGGNKFYPIYQLIDSSTYSRKNTVILKPMNIIREKVELYDINGEVINAVKYMLLVFSKKINPLLLYSSVLGIDNMLKYFFLDDIINVDIDRDENVYEDDTLLYFKAKGSVISVVKYFFEHDKFTQSVVCNLITMLSEAKLTSEEEINDRDYWTIQLGRYYTSSKDDSKRILKAKEIINSFYAIATNIYKSNLKLDEINKSDTFAILRWIMQNFTVLKLKDSLDLKNKRIRLNEYVGEYFAVEVNKKLHRFLSTASNGAQIGSKDLKYLFKYPINIIIKKLMSAKSPLLRYDNSVNDMDFFTAFKYSSKGPSSISDNGSNGGGKYGKKKKKKQSSKTPVSMMAIHHSQLGRIDLNSSSASEPGVTGYFTPFAKTFDGGKFFDLAKEPQSWMDNFRKMYANYFDGKDFKLEPFDYYEDMEKDTNKFLKKLYNIEKFVSSYTGSDKKIRIVDVKRSKKNNVVVVTKESRVLHKQSKSLFKNKPKEPMVIKKLFKNQ